MSTGTVNDQRNGKAVKIDLDGESGRLWMEGAGSAMRLKRARGAFNACRKAYGSKDPRTIDAKARAEAAQVEAENAERAWNEYVQAQG